MGKDNLDGLLDSFNTSAGSLADDLEGLGSKKPNKKKRKINLDDFKTEDVVESLTKSEPRKVILKDRKIDVTAGVDTLNIKKPANDDDYEFKDIDKMTRKEKREYFRIMEAHEFDIEDVLGYPGDFRKQKLDKKFRKKFQVYQCKKPKRVFKTPEQFISFFLEYHHQEKLAAKLINDKKFYAFLRAHSAGDVEYKLRYKKFIQQVSTIFKEVDFSGEF